MTTYIKNKGITQTFFQDNHHHKKSSQIKWDADYNGKHANINVDVQNNGKKNKYRMQLNNNDLAKLLSIPSVNQPLEQRLHSDFLSDFEDDYEYEYEPEELHFQIQPRQHHHEPEPILFRINVPEVASEPKISSPVSINELSSLSTPESLLSEIIHESPESPKSHGSHGSHGSPVSSVIPELVKLTKKQRNARLKTPSPKTMRIHYTTQSLGRGLRKKRQHFNNKSIKTNKKTRKNKTMNRTMNRRNKMKSALTNFFKDRF